VAAIGAGITSRSLDVLRLDSHEGRQRRADANPTTADDRDHAGGRELVTA
jgi:hypothetical protein